MHREWKLSVHLITENVIFWMINLPTKRCLMPNVQNKVFNAAFPTVSKCFGIAFATFFSVCTAIIYSLNQL